MVYGTLIAYIAQLLFQLPLLIKKGYKHRLIVNIKDENIRQILFLIIPVFLGSYINQINAVVNRTLSSTLDSGSITALNYANKLNMFAVGVIAVAISTIMYPILSKLASEGNKKLFKINLSKSINMIIIIMLPIMVIMTTFSTEIVKVLFEEGAFNSHDTYLTSTALFFYSTGILAYGLKELLSIEYHNEPVIILESFLQSEYGISEIILYKELIKLNYIFITNNTILFKEISRYGKVFSFDISRITYSMIVAAINDDTEASIPFTVDLDNKFTKLAKIVLENPGITDNTVKGMSEAILKISEFNEALYSRVNELEEYIKILESLNQNKASQLSYLSSLVDTMLQQTIKVNDALSQYSLLV